MATIDFWCELASTYTYLTACRIEALAGREGVDIRWRPFSLGPIFQAAGWRTSPFEIYADKGRYMWRDVAREAELLGVPFRKPSMFPRNTVPAAKVARLGVDRGWGAEFIKAILHANFAEDRDVASVDVIDSILGSLGVDGPAARHDAASAAPASSLRRSTEEAIALGIFGAPTFMVGTEMFWGNDRLERAIEWAKRT